MLLLDADNSVCCCPAFLFECEQYLATGAIFWCDMYAAGERFVRLWEPLGLRSRPSTLERLLQDLLFSALIDPVRARPDFTRALQGANEAADLPRSHPTQESGQLLVHRGRCLRGVSAAVLLNLCATRSLVYSGLGGDKVRITVPHAPGDPRLHQSVGSARIKCWQGSRSNQPERIE